MKAGFQIKKIRSDSKFKPLQDTLLKTNEIYNHNNANPDQDNDWKTDNKDKQLQNKMHPDKIVELAQENPEGVSSSNNESEANKSDKKQTKSIK
jgi:hypothetical protein